MLPQEMRSALPKAVDWPVLVIRTACFVFFFPAPGCSQEVCDAVDEELLRLKEHPLTAQFPVELTRDLRRIDQIISTDDCALSVRHTGEFMLSWPESPTGLYAQTTSLEQLVRTCLRKGE